MLSRLAYSIWIMDIFNFYKILCLAILIQVLIFDLTIIKKEKHYSTCCRIIYNFFKKVVYFHEREIQRSVLGQFFSSFILIVESLEVGQKRGLLFKRMLIMLS